MVDPLPGVTLRRENELRAALLSVHIASMSIRSRSEQTGASWAHTPAMLQALPDGSRLMSVGEAVEILRAGSTEPEKMAQRVGGMMSLHAAIAARKNMNTAEEDAWIRSCAEITGLPRKDIDPAKYESVADQIYGGDGSDVSNEVPQDDLVLKVNARTDVRTLLTTVTLKGGAVTQREDSYQPPWNELLDPRCWKELAPLFWKASDMRWLVNGEYVPAGPPYGFIEPPIGSPWEGYLYEHAVWSPNAATVVAYQIFLNIRYQVPPSGGICLQFSLHSSQGAVQLATVRQGGINADSGYEKLTVEDYFLFKKVSVELEKRLRYSEVMSRRAPHGPPGAGQVSNFLAAAVVGLWMESLTLELLYRNWSPTGGGKPPR